MDAEAREREELRSQYSVTAVMAGLLAGQAPTGREAEYNAAVGVGSTGIPLAVFEERADAVTPPPTTPTEGTVAPVAPAVFAASLAPQLRIDMPMAAPGSFLQPRMTTNLTAAAKGKGEAIESTAAEITTDAINRKRVSARLSLDFMDRAASALPDYESSLRQNLRAVLSNSLDDFLGDGRRAGREPRRLAPHGGAHGSGRAAEHSGDVR